MKKSDIGPAPGHRIGAVGIAWFNEADYAATLAIMADADRFPPTYKAWAENVEKQVRELERGGHKVFRAVIDPKTFPEWCRRNGFDKIDSRARTRWGAEYAGRQIGL